MSARRPLLTVLLALVALGALTTPEASAQAGRGGAEARLTECETGETARERVAVFEGRMRAFRGVERLEMRFTLQVATPEQPSWSAVRATGFDVWTSALPDVTRYVYTRRVEALVGPARYRTVVRFRWLDADGRLVARAERRSAVCRQPASPAEDSSAAWIAAWPRSAGWAAAVR